MKSDRTFRALTLLNLLFSYIVFTLGLEQSIFLKREVTLGNEIYRYRVYVPKNHNPKQKTPVMLYLHNNGANGTDNEKQIAGFDKFIASKPELFNFIIVFPQARPNSYWVGTQTEQAVKALDQTIKEFNGDPQRVYLAGHSLGGYGTWTAAVMYPNKFAALVPIAGGIVPPFELPPTARMFFPKIIAGILNAPNPHAELAEKIGNTPVWIFHGVEDESIPVKESRSIAAALKMRGSENVIFTEYPETNHNEALLKAFSEPELFKWLGVQSLSKPEKLGANSETVSGKTGKALDVFLSGLVDKGFSGAVLAAVKDEVVLSKGYGYKDRERKIPNTTATVFPIGSVNKQFTAAAIIKLELQGKLKVTDSINKYFKNAPPDKQKITIHQLLTHSSGIPGRVGRCKTETTADDFVQMAMDSTLDFEPGAKYKYSNNGYNLLGVIIEKASGKPYEQYVYDNLLKPAGLENTGTFLPDYTLDNIAVGYRDGKLWGSFFEKIFDQTELPVRRRNGIEFCGRASGGMLSTVGDLYKWHQALESDRILSKKAKRKIFTPHIPENEKATSFYGYGWTIFTTSRKTKLIAHNGGINDVFEADFRRYVDEDVVIIILTNSTNVEKSAIAVSPQIAEIILDKTK